MPEQMLDLYHRTSVAAAAQIRASRAMLSAEDTVEADFSTQRDAPAAGSGEGVIHVRVPEELVDREGEPSEGAARYRIRVADLRPEHFVLDDPPAPR